VKEIKVCHITSAHPDGDVRIFHKECVSLAEEGYDVSLVIPNAEPRVENGVNIVSFIYKPSSRLSRFTKSVNLVYNKAIEVNADIYHLHDPELLRIAVKLKKKGKKVIYDAHEDLPRQILSKQYLKPVLRKLISSRIERYENKVAKKLDAIVTATPYIRDRFLKVNPRTTDINNFPILKELLIDFDYNEKTQNEICYVGGITTVRGINELIASIKHVDGTLLLAGKFLEVGLKDLLEKNANWKKVKELGFLSRSEVKDVYERSKLGVVTLHPISNYYVSLPVKMFEYMAAGIPVVASKFPLWESIITKNNAGLCVDPMNPIEIGEAINYILNNPKEAKIMGENGRKMVIEKYNWDIEKKKLINLYKQLSS
jgi:glycosyltransferase involved in cell wall biosynthesis